MATVIAPDRLFTIEEYFEIEVRSDRKHQFNRGRISVRTGATDNHIEICWNLNYLLGQFLKGKPCRGYGSDMRIEVVADEYYVYPDLSIACPPIKKKKIRGTATLLNPAVIIEVLSPSTESLDRGEKFTEYTKMPSLREYFLISQNVAQVERWWRADDGKWSISVVSGLQSAMVIDSIQCSLPLSEVYDQVELPTDPEVADATQR